MAKKGSRRNVILRNKETGHSYHTTKNFRTTTDRMEISKYDPTLRKHVVYKEIK